jgi:hypothetical protein
MNAAAMMTTMRNMALAPLGDPWALAAGRLIPGVCSQSTSEINN